MLDVDQQRFVDANENAARLFKLTREKLLEVGPRAISPELQSDGSPSFGLARGYVDRALNGGRPVFEWLHRDAEGNDVPCEVRFIMLPSSKRPADTREHHRHCRAPAGRHARVRRTPRARADRGQCAARAHVERRRSPGRAAAPDCRRGGDAARGRKAQARSVDRIGRARGRDARGPAARGEGRRARRCGVPRPADDRARHRRRIRCGSSCATCRSKTACARAARPRSSRRAIEFTARSTFTSTARAARRPRSSISPRGSRSFSALRFAVSSTRPRCATAKRVSARCSTTSWMGSTRPRRLARSCR